MAHAADAFEALADPNRRAIAALLQGGERSVQQLADELPISRPAVSRHLRLLKQGGLVADRAEGTRRLYRLHDEGLAAVGAYLEQVWGDAAARQARGRQPGALMEPLELTFDVACLPARAFELWAERTSLWWPSGHSVSAAPGLTVTFEPRVGGRIYERTPAGVEHDWGEVLDWEPPHRLRYLWHLRFDRSDATEVEVTFSAEGEGTRVALVHRGWERLGAAGAERRERNRRGWGGVLEHYRRACAGGLSPV